METKPTYEELEQEVKELEKELFGFKRIEMELRESEERYRTLIEAMNEGLGIQDKNGLATFANDKLCKMIGYSRDEIIGRPILDFIEESSHGFVKEEVVKRKRGENGSYELVLKGKDNQKTHAIMSSKGIFDSEGQFKGSFGVMIDITERKQVEEALQESEEKFRCIIQNLPMGIHMYQLGPDGQLCFIGANPAADEILGVDNTQFLGKTIYEAFPKIHETEIPERFRIIAEKGGFWKKEDIVYKDEKIEGAFENYNFQASPGKMVSLFLEITERKQAENDIRKSEEKYKYLFESMTQGVFYQNADGAFLDVNDAALELFGLTRDQFLGRDPYDPQWKVIKKDNSLMIPEEYPSLVTLKTGEAIKNHEMGIFNPKKNDYAWLSVSAMPRFRGNETKPYQAFVTIHDITDRKQAEAELKYSEARLKALSEASFESIFLSEKSICLDQNQTAERMFGYTRDEAVGRHGTEWIVPEDREQVKNNMLSGYEQPYEVTALKKDGTTFPCEVQARMMEYQGRLIRITALKDITERKQAEEALRKSEERFRILAETSLDTIYQLDIEGNIIFMNHAGEKMHGYESGMMKGLNFSFLVSEQRLAEAEKLVGKVLSGDNVVGETHVKHKNGKEFPIQYSMVPMKENGKIVGFTGISRDIMDRKQAEEALQKAHDKLEQRVKDRTNELELQKRSLEDVNTALNVMLKKREEDKLMMEKKVLFNVKELIDPLIKNLKKSGLDENQTGYVDTLETFLAEIVSPFSQSLHTKYLKLTLSEIRVANLIKEGKTTKEIASLLNSTPRAIDFHRQNLRKKLGLANRKANLGSHLLSLLK